MRVLCGEGLSEFSGKAWEMPTAALKLQVEEWAEAPWCTCYCGSTCLSRHGGSACPRLFQQRHE